MIIIDKETGRKFEVSQEADWTHLITNEGIWVRTDRNRPMVGRILFLRLIPPIKES